MRTRRRPDDEGPRWRGIRGGDHCRPREPAQGLVHTEPSTDTARTKALDGGEYEEAITATTDTARRLGITGTPTFVFDRRFATVGAQPAEVLLQAIDAALRHTEEE